MEGLSNGNNLVWGINYNNKLKNNLQINLELREYFIKNYSKFSNEYKNKILINFFN